MREIEFRAWDKNNKRMIDDQDQNVQKHYDVKLGSWIHDTVWRIGKLNGTLMQFTGLKDSNSKKIFEGDILKDFSGKISHVFWDEYDAKFETLTLERLTLENALEYEIIGNLFENPEIFNE